jgi:hypothetical protein
MHKNIIILVFLGLMAAAGIYSVSLFNKTEQQKKIISENQKKIQDQLDSNVILKSKYDEVIKRLQKIELENNTPAGGKDSVKNLLEEFKNISEASTKLNNLPAYEQASQLEKEGFTAIANNQFDTALSKFNQIEKITPSFHSSYEISKLLTKQKANLNNPETQQNVKEQIIKNYSWKAPVEQVNKIEIQVKQGTAKDVKEVGVSIPQTQPIVKDAAIKDAGNNVLPTQNIKKDSFVKITDKAKAVNINKNLIKQ